MPLDDRLREGLERAARPADPAGAFERVTARRRRLRLRRRLEAALLSVAVLGGTAVGVYELNRVFRAGAGRAGMVAFVRNLRGCAEHPIVRDGGLQVFAVDVATGEQRLLSTAQDWPDGTLRSEQEPDFSPDGTRFAWVDHYRGNLYVTDVATGDTTKLVTGDVSHPHFSPDGTKILFQTATWKEMGNLRIPGPPAIYAVDADGSNPTHLTRGELPIWTPEGRIAFLRTNYEIVKRREGDGVTIETIPEPTEFFIMNADGSDLEKVYQAPGRVSIRDADWSPDGERVVAEANLHGQSDIYVLDITQETVERLTFDQQDDTSPSWSPDGSMIAFHTGRWGTGVGHAEIAVMNADGSDVAQLTNDCWDDYDPTWIPNDAAVRMLPLWSPPPPPDLGEDELPSPDQILFVDDVKGYSDIYAVSPDGSHRVNVTADLAQDTSPAWSPDHTKIALASDRTRSGNMDIYVMELTTGKTTRLTSGPEDEMDPTWSLDGSRIAFTQEPDQIVVMNADGSERIVVAGGVLQGGDPTWSPDGRTIAFWRDWDLWAVNLDGTDERRLTGGSSADYEPAWSPDGSQILFTGNHELYVVDADGSDVTLLTDGDDATYDRSASWSPDGSQIVFASNRGPGHDFALYVMDADGTHIRSLDTTGGSPAW